MLIPEDLICILGPTASGKTNLAVQLAYEIDGEIISADSRQVYKGMNLGTGKDLSEYDFKGIGIPYHLIDIREAGEAFHLFDFKKACNEALQDIDRRDKKAILCGGTGLYLDAMLFDYSLSEVTESKQFRKECEGFSDAELIEKLTSARVLHNVTDTRDRNRMIRALEIALQEEKKIPDRLPHDYPFIFGLRGDRAKLKDRIEHRLNQRLEEGMIKEVETLIVQGLGKEDLVYYGLEYKFIGLYLFNELNYNDMYQKLRAGIFQFSKRQMTWFRRMEKRGLKINWLNFEDGAQENLANILDHLNS